MKVYILRGVVRHSESFVIQVYSNEDTGKAVLGFLDSYKNKVGEVVDVRTFSSHAESINFSFNLVSKEVLKEWLFAFDWFELDEVDVNQSRVAAFEVL